MFAGGDDVFYGYPGQDVVMNITATVLLAFGMSMDAFAASIGKGATLHKPKFSEALRTGLIFGAVETLTPLIGWGMGMLASRFVLEWNHWIAFVLLIIIGGNMIKEAMGEEEKVDACMDAKEMFLLAIATSIDALAVGVTFAFLKVQIVPAVSFIGCVTFVCSAIGVKIGSIFGSKYRSKAEFCGGVILILIGLKLLLNGLGIM